MMDVSPYRGTLKAHIRWGVNYLYEKYLEEKQTWGHVLEFDFKSERKGFLNTTVTITCVGPHDMVILWTNTFMAIANMEAGK